MPTKKDVMMVAFLMKNETKKEPRSITTKPMVGNKWGNKWGKANSIVTKSYYCWGIQSPKRDNY